MKQILILGAGRSSIYLINYLLKNASSGGWCVRIADANPEAAQALVSTEFAVEVSKLDANHDESRVELIAACDLVISMLPAFMHPKVAGDCLRLGKHLITPSYISTEMKALDAQVREAGLLFINELGVDPGIDHMSAMRLLDQRRAKGEEITWFESFTGGLIAPESDDNPWNYKFTWNPRNVVLAGQGGAVKFKHNNKYKYIPYQKLFRRTEFINIPGHGRFEGYANRDSLKYMELYNLPDIPTIYRGTLRRPGFCRGWDLFVQMGMTDDSYTIDDCMHMTHRDFTNSFLSYHADDSVELKFMQYMRLDQDSDLIERLTWLGIFDQTPIGLNKPSSPAQILQHILEKKWSLKPEDKDMIVMWHRVFTRSGPNELERELHSSMVVKGDDQLHTAMAKTVGLPVAMAAKLVLEGKINRTGVVAPMTADFYNPILNELETYGISFTEREIIEPDLKNR